MDINFIFPLAVLILSVILHEVSHGYAAQMLGDPTARLMGRLTLNPLKHIDPLGSIIIPGLLLITHSNFLFGWAKPVPYNPYNLRGGSWAEAFVAGAGPLTNFFLAVIFGLVIRFGAGFGLPPQFLALSAYIVFINVLLAIFNLIPVPPLDGSKVLRAVLPYQFNIFMQRVEGLVYTLGPIGMFLGLMLVIYVLSTPIFYAVLYVSSAVSGLPPLEFSAVLNSLL